MYDAYIVVEEIKGQLYTGQREQPPVKSIWGNNYNMVLYDYESN